MEIPLQPYSRLEASKSSMSCELLVPSESTSGHQKIADAAGVTQQAERKGPVAEIERGAKAQARQDRLVVILIHIVDPCLSRQADQSGTAECLHRRSTRMRLGAVS
jgi:hypothetical protein